jgi:hypothetical protein
VRTNGRLRRALLVGLGVVVAALLAVDINVITGGTLPSALEPYTSMAWPLAGVLVLVSVALTVWQWNDTRTLSPRAGIDRRSFRDRALRQVGKYVEERMRGSLGNIVRIKLDLDDRPALVAPRQELIVQEVSGDRQPPPADLDIRAAYRYCDESMLILGAPGAGKTTMLLELAARLTEEARADRGRPIPVLLDLGGWGSRRPRFRLPARLHRLLDRFSDLRAMRAMIRRFFISMGPAPQTEDQNRETDPTAWLLGQMRTRYGIGQEVGRAWLDGGELILLLDGLDEVARVHQADCVEWINRLENERRVRALTVCCRSLDYRLVGRKLELLGATEIRPLSRSKTLAYLAQVGPSMNGLAEALGSDDTLWELLDAPIWLYVMALTYNFRHEALDNALAGSIEERRGVLLDNYVNEVLSRRRFNDRYTKGQTVRGLSQLARFLSRANDPSALRRGRISEIFGRRELVDEPILDAMFLTAGLLGMGASLGALFFPLAGRLGLIPAGVIGLIPYALGVVWVFGDARTALVSHWFALMGIALGALGAVAGWWLYHSVWAVINGCRAAVFVGVLTAVTFIALLLRLLVMAEDPARDRSQSVVSFVLALSLPLAARFFMSSADMAHMISAMVATAPFVAFGLPFVSRYRRRSFGVGPLLRSRLGVCAAALLVTLVAYAARGGARLTGLLLGPLLMAPSAALVMVAVAVILRPVYVRAFGPVATYVAYAVAGRLPWRIRRFLLHATDHHLLVRDSRGYRFLHQLLLDHFVDQHAQDHAFRDEVPAARSTRRPA